VNGAKEADKICDTDNCGKRVHFKALGNTRAKGMLKTANTNAKELSYAYSSPSALVLTNALQIIGFLL
jgi:hypothetical protein